MNDITEARIAKLEAEIDAAQGKLTLELHRAAACMEVQNLINRFLFALQGKDAGGCVDEFADRYDISFEIYKFGVFKSKAKIKKLLETEYYADGKIPGARIELNTLTPNIAIAGDGKTAKGLWSCFGYESAPVGGGKLGATWDACQIGVDFIFEDGVWKIWHLQIFDTFVSDYRQSWTKGEPEWYRPELAGWPEIGVAKGDADEGPTFYRPYDQKIPRLYWPQTPQPYYTYENGYPMVGAPPEGADL